MVQAIPTRLRKEPLVEVVWQVVFDPPRGVPVGDILPGLLFSQLRNQEPGLRLVRLPAADVPAPVAAAEPAIRNAVKFRLEADNSPFLIQLGDRIVTFNCRAPYSGWTRFKTRVFELIDQLVESGLIGAVERHSLRYIDHLQIHPTPSIEALQIPLMIGGFDLKRCPVQIRAEVGDGEFQHLVQVLSPVEVQIGDSRRLGTLVDLETIAPAGEVNWSRIRESLDSLHHASKRMFFQSLLTPESIVALEPEYDHIDNQ